MVDQGPSELLGLLGRLLEGLDGGPLDVALVLELARAGRVVLAVHAAADPAVVLAVGHRGHVGRPNGAALGRGGLGVVGKGVELSGADVQDARDAGVEDYPVGLEG